MGYYNDSKGVKCFEPDNTETRLYIEVGYSEFDFHSVVEQAAGHFGLPDPNVDSVSFNQCAARLKVSAEYIHVNAIGYDRYDPSDYAVYLVIDLKEE